MLDQDIPKNELEVYEWMTAGFIRSIVRAARLIPGDKWNWSFDVSTPTAREVCEHTFMWLWCDRQQMTVLDRSQHREVPPLPTGQNEMIACLESEGKAWTTLLRGMSASELDAEREPWPGERRNLRGFFFHMGQHTIFKAGQIWMIVYGLGLDGVDPYTAPHPNTYYGFPIVPAWPGQR